MSSNTRKKSTRQQVMLEDKNRDGIPDQYETLLRILGWAGRLIGEPRLREKIEQQIRMQQNVALDRTTTASNKPPAASRARTGVRNTTAQQYTPAVVRMHRESRTEGGLGEFLRKLLVVSAVVTAGYAALRLFGLV